MVIKVHHEVTNILFGAKADSRPQGRGGKVAPERANVGEKEGREGDGEAKGG